MTHDQASLFFNFLCFLKERSDGEFADVDRACLYIDLFKDVECLTKVLPLYFFLTREKEAKVTLNSP